MKIILDTNIFISAFITNGKSQELFNKLETLNIDIFLSDEILQEIKATFNKPKLLKYIHNKNSQYSVENYIKLIQYISTITNPTTKINLCRDPKDNMILELAYTKKANYIISGDKDLLVLNGERFEGYTFNVVDVSGFLGLWI